jgi:hypothetical protein
MFFVDGTVMPTLKSVVPALNRATWNIKHAFNAKCFTILVTENGGIVWASKSVPGKMADRTAWNKSGIAPLLAETYRGVKERNLDGTDSTDFQLAIGGDKGYPGIWIPKGWQLHLTKSAKRTAFPSEVFTEPIRVKRTLWCPKGNQIIMDERLSQFRSVVERTIAKLKEFELLLNAYFVYNHNAELDNCIQVVCGIFNYNLRNSIQ